MSEEVHNQWVSGNRDELTLALVRALKQCGFETDHKTRCAVRVGDCPTYVLQVKSFLEYIVAGRMWPGYYC